MLYQRPRYLSQLVIIANGAVMPMPVVIEEEICARQIAQFSLSVDHRWIDGSLATQFLARVKEFIEFPKLLVG
jgi:pyruvate/2-oxoglutarate dehydrogenase complex dihydrolipoamide acyltransferase (E2) component